MRDGVSRDHGTEAWSPETVHCGEEEARGDLVSVCKYLKEQGKEKVARLFSSGARCQERRKWAQTETHVITSESQEV